MGSNRDSYQGKKENEFQQSLGQVGEESKGKSITDYRPKWVEEVMQYIRDTGFSGDKVHETLLRINTLLCIASSETDNEFLHEDIEKEIQNVSEYA